ncbi:MAG: hypothetical protein CTY15_08410 [Methylocystis sp.]|nr:MAG: hypothetical protein CTY15_08410 [Methylocystis sp.]
MADWSSLWRRLTDYAAAEDPLTRASNTLALVLASNQPFYPFYVRWVTGEGSWLLGLTFVSTPFFLAAPWVARRIPNIGRLYFPAVGAINTFFCAFIFGVASGVELFLAPCLVIAALSCRKGERVALGVFLVALLGAFLLLHRRYGAPLYLAGPSQYDALLSLNVYSAAILSVIAAWTFSAAWSETSEVRK